jgi:hypothetical protein
MNNPSPAAQHAKRKIAKVHSQVQREALGALLIYVEDIDERMRKAADVIEKAVKGE